MTKVEALERFKRDELPYIIEKYGEKDKVAIRTAWVDYTDYLMKNGEITENQCANWGNPYS